MTETKKVFSDDLHLTGYKKGTTKGNSSFISNKLSKKFLKNPKKIFFRIT